MKLKGGYNVLLQGKPDGNVTVMPEPQVLYLPLQSHRFNFTQIDVTDGQHVRGGDILANDPDNHAVPLLAPRAGVVRLNRIKNHVVLEVESDDETSELDYQKYKPHINQKIDASGIKRCKLLTLGAWQFFYDAFSGNVPNPLENPQAVIISTVSLEPFTARGDVQLHKRLLNFTRGLEHLQSLLEYQPIYLVMPNIKSEFANMVRNNIRGYAWVKMLEVPLVYPHDNFAVLARRLGLKRKDGPVWALRAEGVLAVDRSLTLSKPCTVRIVSIGGVGVNSPTHLKVMPGYPLKEILEKYVSEPMPRVLDGGVFTGKALGPETMGIDSECRGITVIGELQEREFLGFIRPGWDRSSYAPCFLSFFRKSFRERFSTGVRGERRPCISCGFCEEVCPAGIMPYLIHKQLYADLLEEAESAGLDFCVECGLCSFVCPSSSRRKTGNCSGTSKTRISTGESK